MVNRWIDVIRYDDDAVYDDDDDDVYDDDDDDTHTRSCFHPSSIQPSPLLFNSSIQPSLYLSIYVSINHFAAPIAVKRHVVCATSLVTDP